MARYTGSKCRLCRREGIKLFLKGQRCNTDKCSFTKRQIPPGMHTHLVSKKSYYALQLREKQKAKRIYGILEKQFKRFFKMAEKSKGVTGRVLIQLLERRLDNVIYRANFAVSRDQARQFTRHGFVFIGNKRVNIPSYLVKEGEVIEFRAKDEFRKIINNIIESESKIRSVPKYLEVDNQNLKIKILRLPEKEDLNIAINEQLIVELYSK